METVRAGSAQGAGTPRPAFPSMAPDISWPEALHLIAGVIPDRDAIDDGSEKVTYADLDRRANRLAHAIVEHEPDHHVPIAVITRQGIGAVTGFLGPLHAHRVSAFLDAGEPLSRLEALLDASLATTIVTERLYLPTVEAVAAGRTIITLEDTDSYDDTVLDAPVGGPTPGFIVFTSGSTGTPKGVVITHTHLVRDLLAQIVNFEFPSDASFPLIAAFGFSASIGQVLPPLVCGATVYPFNLASRGARQFAEWVNEHELTQLQIVSSLLRALSALDPPVAMPTVKMVMLTGEMPYGRDIKRARAMFEPGVTFVNSFGSTEAYSITSFVIAPADVPGDGPLPMGKPNPGVEVTLVDPDSGEEVGDDDAGRLVIVADYLSHSYWNDPELTADHYFTSADGRSGFRTSDLVRRRADGNLEHVGRLDSRVKVRGAMVATSEVEQAVLELDGVADAAVVGVPTTDGGTRLVAYVVGDGSTPLSAWRLRRDLASYVPTTMLPASFVALAELPRTVRGKVDRTALPTPPPGGDKPYRAPVANEGELAELFEEVLGVERIGVDDDFFDLGGDSLGVLELVEAINARFGFDVSTTAIIEAPTVASLAPRLGNRRPSNASVVVPLHSPPKEEAAPTPFFCASGAGAPALSLRALAAAIGDRPVFGIQARGLEERGLPDRSVEAVASRAIDAIRAEIPRGPYAIGGFSFGALVAFEIACRLEATGEDAGVLVVIDSVSPRRTRKRKLAVRRKARSVTLMQAGLLPRRGLHQYQSFIELHQMMAADYAPRMQYGGSVLLVRTHVEFDEDARGSFTEHDFRWSRVASGGVTVVDLPGHHLDLLRSPVVGDVGNVVREALSSAR